jgi:type VI secretion system protein ImpM
MTYQGERLPDDAVYGFHGKLPARGDFVRSGLRRDFCDAWDGWVQRGMAASREALADGWLPAWLEAPVWRFAFAAGVCGSEAAIGLFLPSVDRAGRYFPLAIAATTRLLAPRALARRGAGFLAAAEAAGLAALAEDLTPDALAQLVAAAARAQGGELPAALATLPDRGSLWWTEGAPRVPPCALQHDSLPAAAAFAAMLVCPMPAHPILAGAMPASEDREHAG